MRTQSAHSVVAYGFVETDFFIISKIDQLLDVHIQLQLGCYFDGIEFGPGKSQFPYSNTIPDIAWNFATGINRSEKSEIDWLLQVAAAHRRKPTIFVSSENEASAWARSGQFGEAIAENWMTIQAQEIIDLGPMRADLTVEVTENAVPQKDFLFLFSSLFRDQATNKHFEHYYVPALKNARQLPNVRQRHYVLYSCAEPVACASMYWRNDMACLYNVGTHVAQQKKGYGTLVSRLALADLGKCGCNMIFLQSECDANIMRLYSAIGFASTFTPYSIVLLTV